MDPVSHLRKLVSINSVFPNEREIGEHCEKYLRSIGFSITRIDLPGGRPNIIATRGTPSLAFYGHLDTVPVYGKWDSDPHILTEKEGKLYGIGAGDMKGGIAALFSALEKSHGDAMVVLCSDEENISLGANLLVSHPELFSEIELMVSCEFLEQGDEGGIMLGRRGRAVYEVTVRGTSSHGATAEKGINAVEKACELILALQKFPAKKGARLGDSTFFVRSFSAESTSLSVPDSAKFQIDAHLVDGQTVEGCMKEFEIYMKRVYSGFTIDTAKRETPFSMPCYVEPKNRGVKILSKIVKDVAGKSFFTVGLSVADENVFSRRFPCVVCGPVSANYHSANEWVGKASLMRASEIYARLIEKWKGK